MPSQALLGYVLYEYKFSGGGGGSGGDHGQYLLAKISSKSWSKHGVISCAPHTSFDEIKDGIVKSGRGELARGTDPPLVYSRALISCCAVARAKHLGQKTVLRNSCREAGCAQRNMRFWARNIFRRRRFLLVRRFFAASEKTDWGSFFRGRRKFYFWFFFSLKAFFFVLAGGGSKSPLLIFFAKFCPIGRS